MGDVDVFGFEEETGGRSFGGGADDDLVSSFGSKRLSESRGLTAGHKKNLDRKPA